MSAAGALGLLGGAFDPPHNGHVALARDAVRQLALGGLVVLVVADPGHKAVQASAADRLALAGVAFPGQRVVLDSHGRTVDMLRDGSWEDPVFLVGADEFVDFPAWKEPDGVLELARLGVASRPGYPRERFAAVLESLRQPERVLFFEIEPLPVSSSEVRRLLAAGDRVEGLVPDAVAAEIEARGLYR